MPWRKLGLIFKPSGSIPWMKSHAALPTAEPVKKDLFKIYFSTRDAKSQSHAGYLLIDMKDPFKILDVSKNPILSPGGPGSFDEQGAMLSWITHDRNRSYFYYFGWNLGSTVPFRNSIGLATQAKAGAALKLMPGPILDRSIYDPCFTANPCVLKEKGIWKMWYLSCVSWEKTPRGLKHWYHLKYAESADGITWDRKGIVAIDFKDKNEYAISRPCVLKENGIYKMWFSYRGDHYRIGYAESKDGKKWTRTDKKAGLDVSESGWDSEMIEYPFVFNHGGKRHMLYNGNDYGRTGFGLAVWEDSK